MNGQTKIPFLRELSTVKLTFIIMFLGQVLEALLILQSSCNPITVTSIHRGPFQFKPLHHHQSHRSNVHRRQSSYGAPQGPAPATSYDAPILGNSGGSSSFSPGVSSSNSFAPVLSSYSSAPSSVPSVPEYNENCVVERSTENTGPDCQQGGQECSNQCSSQPREECSNSPAAPVCVTVNEQKCEIQYETVYEEVCENSAVQAAPVCQEVQEEVCDTVQEQECTNINERVCEPSSVVVSDQECSTVMEDKCETEYMTKYEEQCRTATEEVCSTVNEQQCSQVQEEQCRSVSDTVTEEECQEVQEQRCDTVYRQQCGQRTEQQCETVTEQQCQVR